MQAILSIGGLGALAASVFTLACEVGHRPRSAQSVALGGLAAAFGLLFTLAAFAA